jgi:diguanylate cyclase (GGDEF)-like protein/PAS domain S-box-containing protein
MVRRGVTITRSTSEPSSADEQRRSLLESVVLNANDVVLVTEAEPVDLASGGPKVIYVNPAFTRMTGYQESEIVGLTPRVLQSPRTDRAELDRVRRALAAWEPVEVELLNVHKDGTEFWAQISITPVTDDRGWFTHWVSIQRDVTIRKRRELALRGLMASATVVVLTLDQAQNIVSAGDGLHAMFDHSLEDVVGRPLASLVHPEDVVALGLVLAPPLGIRLDETAVELRVRHRDGSWRWMKVTATEHVGSTSAFLLVAMTDISERRRTEDALRLSNDRFRSAFNDAPIGMAVTEPAGRFVQVNAALTRLLGREDVALLGMRIDEVLHPDDVEAGRRQRQALLDGELTHHQLETRFVHRDGSVVGVLHSSSVIPGADGSPQYIVDHIEDITGRKQFEAQLQHQASHDPLTGLPNRALLTRRLARLLEGDPADRSLAVLFLDLDRFKQVNDSLGHLGGDSVLVECARRLQTFLGPGDTLSRLGGDEFVIVHDGCTLEQARARANGIATAMRAPFRVAGSDRQLSISIGIAMHTRADATAEQMLSDADAAMYSAKERGRSRFQVFDDALGSRVNGRMQNEAELRAAILGGQLRLHYQPEVRLADRVIHGLEALVRWQHPVRGLLPPGDFIALAESTGLIDQLGDWVIEEALQEIVRRRGVTGSATPVMWINVSVHQLQSPTFAPRLSHLLRQYGVAGEAVGLEVTESVLMTEADDAREQLDRLKALGVGLAIDDFGTGYSSLSYLARFPVDIVKIDGGFTARLDDPATRRESFALINAVVGLAQALRLQVIAEGIETVSQAQALHGLGCDFGQGYLLGRPSPSGDLAADGADLGIT